MHRVVIVGCGFAGLFAARALRRAPVEVVVVDRTNHHLFQPLLYQVATGVLSEGDVAPPVRDVLRHQKNNRVVLGEVVDLDPDGKSLTIDTLGRATALPYDSLILATGATQSYFGHNEYALHAPGLKSIDDAPEQRGRIFGAFEMAELEADSEARRSWLTFAIVGAGPTRVELAGQIAELSRRALRENFRQFEPQAARVVLVDAGDCVLEAYPQRLRHRAHRDLPRLGVEIRLMTQVVGVDATGLDVVSNGTRSGHINAHTKVWAAGVQASPIGRLLADRTGATTDRAGRVEVWPDCSVPGHPEVFVVGDLIALNGLPGLAEVAMQSGYHAARTIMRRLRGRQPKPLRYVDPRHDGDDRPVACGGEHRATPGHRSHRLVGVARSAPGLSDRVQELAGSARQLGCRLPRPRPSTARHHQAAGAGQDPGASSRSRRRTRSHASPMTAWTLH